MNKHDCKNCSVTKSSDSTTIKTLNKLIFIIVPISIVIWATVQQYILIN